MTDRWIVFRFAPVALFSLKMSRATSTAGKTLLTPTPYSVKMAFLDAALRHGLVENPDMLVRHLAIATLRIGIPQDACVTGTIQSIRQERSDDEDKRTVKGSRYRASIAMREFVHFQGYIRLAFDLETSASEFIELLLRAGPAINYLGKRGSFVQYMDVAWQPDLDSTFTFPVSDGRERAGARGLITTLDDFGAQASFAALNSFSSSDVKPGIHRNFVDTVVPFALYNAGPDFAHYSMR